jgi:hypothetical protein
MYFRYTLYTDNSWNDFTLPRYFYKKKIFFIFLCLYTGVSKHTSS